MNIIIMNNRASFLVSFWSVLISRLQEEGHQVTCLVPAGDSEAEATLKGFGTSIRNYPLDNKGLNPVHDLKTCLALYRIFREERADILYASTIKSVIYGIPMAALAGIRSRYAMITGLGYMFEANTPVKKMLTYLASSLYRISLSFSDAVFFQNTDDVQTFRDWHCLPRGAHVVMTKGTGVDTDKFAVAPLPEAPLTFLLVGRLLEAKGLYEYAEAARLVKKRHPNARFQLLGAPESSRGGVPLETVKGWEREGIIEYLGVTRDVRPLYRAGECCRSPLLAGGLAVFAHGSHEHGTSHRGNRCSRMPGRGRRREEWFSRACTDPRGLGKGGGVVFGG